MAKNKIQTTNIFKDWLPSQNLKDVDNLFELYESVRQKESCGGFTIQPAKGQKESWIVSSMETPDFKLLIPSESGRITLLNILDSKNYTPDGIGVEAYYNFKKSMEKDD